ncbi:MAG: thiol:disulfide interchange protein DsbA/DsbL [Pseudomonadales bacterium]
MSKEKSFLAKQKIALGLVSLIVIGIVIYFSTIVVKDAPIIAGFVEGEHYKLLENPRRVRGDKIEVMEFFSYGCIHCYNLDPELNAWAEASADKVKFVRTPAISSDYWRMLGRNYYTMQKLGMTEESHLLFFRQVHDVKRNFSSIKRLAAYFDGKGTTAEEYTKAFNSPEVARKIATADQLSRRMLIANVPTMIVNGKYMVQLTRTVGVSRMLEVLDFLVDKELADKELSIVQ